MRTNTLTLFCNNFESLVPVVCDANDTGVLCVGDVAEYTVLHNNIMIRSDLNVSKKVKGII